MRAFPIVRHLLLAVIVAGFPALPLHGEEARGTMAVSVPGGADHLQALATRAAQLSDGSLTLLAEKDSAEDTEYYQDGIWHSKDESDLRLQMAAGCAAATLWKWLGSPLANPSDPAANMAKRERLFKMSIATIDRQIKDNILPTGNFRAEEPTTYLVAIDLGKTFLLLGDSLDPATRERWRSALKGMVEYLIKTNDLPMPGATGWQATDGWYTNGYVEIGEAEMLYLAAEVTGEKRYHDLFELQWKHTLEPDENRWGKKASGFGLCFLKEPANPDGTDGAAYLGESGQDRKPGFDPEDTHFSLILVASLYVRSRDARVLRLGNLLLNSLLPRTDRNTWMLDATNGSTHSSRLPMFSSGLAVLALAGNRTDLAPMVDAQFEKGLVPVFRRNPKRAFEGNLGAVLEAAMAAH